MDDDDENRADHVTPSGGRSHPGEDNDNDHGVGDEDKQRGENATGTWKGTRDGKRKGKATEDGKGKGKGKKGNGKGKDIVEQTPGGDDISRAVAFQVQKEISEADLDTKG